MTHKATKHGTRMPLHASMLFALFYMSLQVVENQKGTKPAMLPERQMRHNHSHINHSDSRQSSSSRIMVIDGMQPSFP